jgi:hypothetical protein
VRQLVVVAGCACSLPLECTRRESSSDELNDLTANVALLVALRAALIRREYPYHCSRYSHNTQLTILSLLLPVQLISVLELLDAPLPFLSREWEGIPPEPRSELRPWSNKVALTSAGVVVAEHLSAFAFAFVASGDASQGPVARGSRAGR